MRLASCYVPRATCLVQALAAQVLLSWQGLDSHLRIGVALSADKEFEAHAWVECDGIALNEPQEPHQHYSAFDAALSSLPADER